jgi:hypothetical protein
MTRITGTLHEDICTFMISRRILLRMRNVSDKSCRENRNTRFMLNNVFFFENRGEYEIIWKNSGQLGKTQMTT